MSGPIESEYFDWLCAKVLDTRSHVFTDLMRILYTTEFVWSVFGDRNRNEDGIELRHSFVNESGWEKDPLWFDEPCSLLEFFIALGMRASFQTDIPTRNWFWTFLSNLRLDEYRRVSDFDLPVIEDVLYTFVWRKYDEYGRGGIFPLDQTQHDQREVEVWYQLFEYIDDQGLV